MKIHELVKFKLAKIFTHYTTTW